MNLSPGLWTPVAHGQIHKVNITTINSATNIRQNKHNEETHPNVSSTQKIAWSICVKKSDREKSII